MDVNKIINFLEKPKIKIEELGKLKKQKVYVNLFEIKMNKDLTLYQYPYTIIPPIGNADSFIRDKLFKFSEKKLKTIFGDCFISGDSLYSMKEMKENIIVNSILYLKGKIDYEIEFNDFGKKKLIKNEDIQKDPLSKQFIEMIIKDILHSNPKLEFYKDVFVIPKNKKHIETDKFSIFFYPGFTTSFVETESGNYLNVNLKNKLIQDETIYDYLNNFQYKKNKHVQDEIKEKLRDRSFKVSYDEKKNYRIDDILFENYRTPKKQTIFHGGKTINLVEYYKKAHYLTIKDENQPLILVRK